MHVASTMDEQFSDSEVVLEEDVWEVEDIDEGRPPEDDLQEEMEDIALGEEEEEEEEEGSIRNDAMAIFKGHSGSVFSVCLHPDSSLACSGGEDDKAFIWRTSDASVLMECNGHQDSVTCTGFSHDGKYVATGDMGGGVRVWSVGERQPACVFETTDIEWLHWHPQAHVLLAGTSDGGGWMWKVPSGDCKTFQGQNCRNICCAIMPDGKHVCCGYEDGGVRVWSLKECSTVVTMSPGHAGPVNCITVHPERGIMMTGSEDSTARLVNTTTGKVIATLAAGMPQETSDTERDSPPSSSVEAVAFCPSLPLAITASLSGAVGVWDIATQKLRHKLHHQAGVVRVLCSSADPLVLTGCLDGAVRVWDVRGGECVKEYWGHTRDLLDLTLAHDNSIVVSASDDATVQVFPIKSLSK